MREAKRLPYGVDLTLREAVSFCILHSSAPPDTEGVILSGGAFA